MKNTVLITGGLGYIGSHTAVAMMDAGYQVVIIDSLANSRLDVLDRIEKITGEKPVFEKLDLCDDHALDEFMQSPPCHDIGAVIHFAAYKNVGESVGKPLKYYRNNILSLINLLSAVERHGIQRLVYSSSCSVYGNPDVIPVTEEAPLQPAVSPYGNTKRIGEEIIRDAVIAGSVQAVSLRYFNPIGAHPSNCIGEFPGAHADNLIPALMATARGRQYQFFVYGDDYNTPDGTCIRDYIDVLDLAQAHVKSVERLKQGENENNCEVFNLGTGKGASVLEMIRATEKVTGQKIPFEVKPRREGDVEAVYANPELANRKLGWKASRSLEDMIATAWAWSDALQNPDETGQNKKLSNNHEQ